MQRACMRSLLTYRHFSGAHSLLLTCHELVCLQLLLWSLLAVPATAERVLKLQFPCLRLPVEPLCAGLQALPGLQHSHVLSVRHQIMLFEHPQFCNYMAAVPVCKASSSRV